MLNSSVTFSNIHCQLIIVICIVLLQMIDSLSVQSIAVLVDLTMSIFIFNNIYNHLQISYHC